MPSHPLRHRAPSPLWAEAARKPPLVFRTLSACLAALCLSLALCSGSARAQARVNHVDGVSDQNLAHWDNASFNVSSFSNGYLAGLFRVPPTGGRIASQIKLARIVIPWDVMAGAAEGSERLHYHLLAAWLEDVKWLGLTPDVAVEQAETSVTSAKRTLPRVPRSSEEYEEYVSALLAYAASVGEPIQYLEAWNEPNNTGLGNVNAGHPSAAAAAHFMNAASSLCATRGCTPIAGDFLDSQYAWRGHEEVHEQVTNTGMGVSYEDEYVAHLLPRRSIVWGFHPYAAVKYKTTETVTAFEQGLPGGSDNSVWFTEVGAYLCQRPSHRSTELEQKAGAEYLVRLIRDRFDVAHAFYYEISNGYHTETNCATGSDTSLYDKNDQPRPAAGIILESPVLGSIISGPLGEPAFMAPFGRSQSAY